MDSSTTQMIAGSRRGSAQIRQVSSDATLPQIEQNRTLSLTSVRVWASRAHVVGIGGQQVERDALGALRPDPRQPAELVDQILDRTLVHA